MEAGNLRDLTNSFWFMKPAVVSFTNSGHVRLSEAKGQNTFVHDIFYKGLVTSSLEFEGRIIFPFYCEISFISSLKFFHTAWLYENRLALSLLATIVCAQGSCVNGIHGLILVILQQKMCFV